MGFIEKTVLGLMSGTSLDGIDLVLVQFQGNEAWQYSILHTETIPYSNHWITRLGAAVDLPKQDLPQLDHAYTLFLGEIIKNFLSKKRISIDFISSHGHTILHQPAQGITYQIGNLPLLAEVTGHKVICDFRVADVALNGQGAPLVPGGEIHLFSDYTACVNLGGFANITLLNNQPVVAFDICPVNIVMNELVKSMGLNYDNNGDIARSGLFIPELFERLNVLSFYQDVYPKSLGIEWVHTQITPLLDEYTDSSLASILHTFSKHIASQLAAQLPQQGEVLFTGGGCYNGFLMEQIQKKSTAKIVIPSPELIEFKEAIIFGFLGLLRDLDMNNCLASVTGAKHDHSSGNIFSP